jgi:hypothetical protein
MIRTPFSCAGAIAVAVGAAMSLSLQAQQPRNVQPS